MKAENSGLGLADRRALKEYQEKAYPKEKKKINEAAGFDLAVEIDWNSVATPGEGSSYNEADYWTKIYFRPLTAALRAIAVDDIGKTALEEKLKKVVIHCTPDAPANNYSAGLRFEDGTLTIDWRQYTNAGDVNERTEAIQNLLEAEL
jgi:hypothetical protein